MYPDALDRKRFDHLTECLVDGGTAVYAVLPAFEKPLNGKHLICGHRTSALW
jgi:hypothetical protein